MPNRTECKTLRSHKIKFGYKLFEGVLAGKWIRIILFAFAAMTLLPFSTASYAQNFAPEKDLVGRWDIDLVKTKELLSTPNLKELGMQLFQIPIATQAFQFTEENRIAFDTFQATPDSFEYSVESFERKSGNLTLKLKQNGRHSTAHLTVKDSDTLVLDVPMSIVGPLQIAYSRKVPKGKNASSPITKFLGEWILDRDATAKLWTKINSASAQENYKPSGIDALSDAETMTIDTNSIEFSDQTFIPCLATESSKDRILIGRTFGRGRTEIFILNQDVIQITCEKRRLFAVYRRAQNSSAPIDSFAKSEIADNMLRLYSTNEARPPLSNRVGSIGQSGNVEIEGISIERRRASNAVASADLVTMSLEFFVAIPEKNYADAQNLLLRVMSLREIEDSEGNNLLTERRRNRIEYLKHPVRTRGSRTKRDGSTGPTFSIKLDAPSIGATSLKRIAGEIELTPYLSRKIRFRNVGSIQGEPLKHPLLEGLDIRPEIKNGRFPDFNLKLAPSAEQQIVSWHLETNSGVKLKSTSVGRGGGEINKGYREPIPDDATLVMEVVKLKPGRKFPFEFKDVRLP